MITRVWLPLDVSPWCRACDHEENQVDPRSSANVHLVSGGSCDQQIEIVGKPPNGGHFAAELLRHGER
jgi:hypothetical protein